MPWLALYHIILSQCCFHQGVFVCWWRTNYELATWYSRGHGKKVIIHDISMMLSGVRSLVQSIVLLGLKLYAKRLQGGQTC